MLENPLNASYSIGISRFRRIKNGNTGDSVCKIKLF